jgi:hypothetical protein
MTKLLYDALTTVSEKFSQQEQDKLAYLLVENMESLRVFLENETDERCFDAAAMEAIESEKVQSLLKRVAEKHHSHPC